MEIGQSSRLSRRQTILQLLGVAALASTGRLKASTSSPPIRSRRFSVPLVNELGEVTSRFDSAALYFAEDLGAGVQLEMALIPGGSFEMGSTLSADRLEEPVRRVVVRPFALGVFAVTRAHWRQVSTFPRVAASLPALPLGDFPMEVHDRIPADVVSWDEAEEFCRRLEQHTGRPYRLPSEAEWEYACRAGTTTRYHFGEAISRTVANYNDGIYRPLRLTPVGSKQVPNRYGLHDMHGNVLEWCADGWHPNYVGAPEDARPWREGADPFSRIGRGGDYLSNEDSARSAARHRTDVRGTWGGLGFRVASDSPIEIFDPVIRGSVTNAASGLLGPIAPGEIVSIRGINLGPMTPVSLKLDDAGLVSAQLAGVRVLIDGVPAPVLYVSTDQVNAIVPYRIAPQTQVDIIIERDGQTSAPLNASVAESAPGVFTTDSSGVDQAVVLNQDGSQNGVNNPALKASVITIFATGEGRTNPPGIDGKLATGPSVPFLPVQLFIANVRADVLYAGTANGQVAGLLQVEARVPDGIAAGRQPVVLTVGEGNSQPGVFVVIR